MTTKITGANITNTGVTAGSYTSANITVNAQGQITAAANGSGGGGGGGAVTGGAGGSSIGGAGGGGTVNGSNASPANRGGGGGGAGASGSGGGTTGGNGSGGIVILRYADTFAPAASTTGSPTYTISGGYRIYEWTGNGSITF